MSVKLWTQAALRSLIVPASTSWGQGPSEDVSRRSASEGVGDPVVDETAQPHRRRGHQRHGHSPLRRRLRTALLVLATSVVLKLCLEHATAFTPPFRVEGWADERFRRVREQFEANFRSGWEERGGASLAVYHKGRLVVDLWGGQADVMAGRPWTRDTLTVIYSSTKALAALTVAWLVERGRLSYDDRVAAHWPAFAAQGKENITLRQVLSHRAGLAYLDGEVDPLTTTGDHEAMGRLLAAQTPNWEPGTGAAYHAFTHGWLLDQIVRRSDHRNRSLAQVFREEIAEPQGVEAYIGFPKELYHRLSRPRWTGALDSLRRAWDPRFVIMQLLLQSEFLKPWSIIRRTFANPMILAANMEGNLFDNPDVLAQEWPAANGVSASRELARLFSLLAEGQVLEPHSVRALERPESIDERDLGLGLPVSWGLGFMMTRPPKGDHWQFGSPGAGGQNLKVDLRHRLAFAYNTNALKPEMGDLTQTFNKLQTAIYDCLDDLGDLEDLEES